MSAAERKLRPIRDAKELAGIPISEPVLVELPEPVSGLDAGQQQEVQQQQKSDQDKDADALIKQLETLKAADAERQKALERTQQEAAKDRQARLAAEQEAQRILAREQKSTKEFFSTALDGARAEGDAAEIEFQSAVAANDAAAMAKAQRKLARAEAKITQLEASQVDFEVVPAQREPEQQRPTQIDLMAQVDSNPNFLDAEKKWLKEHPELILDQRKNNELGVGYERAMRQGLQRGTEGYFKFLNEFMGYQAPAVAAQQTQENENVAAPVSRETQNSPNDRRVYLSPEQRELARGMGVTDEQYADGVLKLRVDKSSNPEKYNMARG